MGQIYRETEGENLSRFYCCQRHKFVIRALLCSSQYFYIVGSDVWLSNTYRMHCCVLVTTMLTLTLHNVTLHLHCLAWFILMRLFPFRQLKLAPPLPSSCSAIYHSLMFLPFDTVCCDCVIK